VTITLSLGDFVAIAAIVLIFSRGIYAWAGGSTPRQLRAQRQLDAIMKHLGLPEPVVSHPGALSPQVHALLVAGQRTEAIKLYRQETGAGLKEAKSAVDGQAAAAQKVG
jgi:hypothetical protein